MRTGKLENLKPELKKVIADNAEIPLYEDEIAAITEFAAALATLKDKIVEEIADWQLDIFEDLEVSCYPNGEKFMMIWESPTYEITGTDIDFMELVRDLEGSWDAEETLKTLKALRNEIDAEISLLEKTENDPSSGETRAG